MSTYDKKYHLGIPCPECDQNLNCTWNRVCYHGEVCLIRQYENTPFTVHCSEVIHIDLYDI